MALRARLPCEARGKEWCPALPYMQTARLAVVCQVFSLSAPLQPVELKLMPEGIFFLKSARRNPA